MKHKIYKKTGGGEKMNVNVNAAAVEKAFKDTHIKSNLGKKDNNDSFLKTFNKFIEKHKHDPKEVNKKEANKEVGEDSEKLDEDTTMSILNGFLLELPINMDGSLEESQVKHEPKDIGMMDISIRMDELSEEVINLENFDLTSQTEEDKPSKTSELPEFNLEAIEKENLDLERLKPPTRWQDIDVDDIKNSVDEISQDNKSNKDIRQIVTKGSEGLTSQKVTDDTVKMEPKDLIAKGVSEVKEPKPMASENVKPIDIEVDSLEIPKNLDNNFIFNRIQNMFFNLDMEQMQDTLSFENLQNIKDSMVQFMKISKEGDTSVMKVRLYPEELGSINISLKLYKGGLIADIIVESEKIKALFLNSSNVLNRTLVEQDIPVKNINISVSDNFNSFEGFSEEASGGDKHQNPREDLNRNNHKDLNTSPLDDMRVKNIRDLSKGLNILA